MIEWKKLAVSPEVSILQAMRVIDEAGSQFVMVVDSSEKILGVVTDGDIRRGLLRNISLNSEVTTIMNRSPKVLSKNVARSEAVAFMRSNGILHVPLVDQERKVFSLVSLNEEPDPIKNTVVLMVGGLGSRLGELTSNCPKPMLPVNGRPVLEMIVESLREHGFRDFIFCVNYRADMIQSHFGDGKKMGVNIRYVHESKRMGTAGALTLLPNEINGPILVMNGDIMTKVNFSCLLDYHREHNSQATMAVRKYDFEIPYGVVETDGGLIKKIVEKPIHSFLVSAGIYVVETECFRHLPDDTFFDMPQLFEKIMAEKDSAQAFPIHEYWIDIGREDDLLRAHNDLSDVGSQA